MDYFKQVHALCDAAALLVRFRREMCSIPLGNERRFGRAWDLLNGAYDYTVNEISKLASDSPDGKRQLRIKYTLDTLVSCAINQERERVDSL